MGGAETVEDIDTVEEPLTVDVGVTVLVAVPEGVLVPLFVGVGGAETVLLPLVVVEGVIEDVPVLVPVGVPVEEGVVGALAVVEPDTVLEALTVRVRVNVGEAVLEGVPLLDGVLERVPVEDTVPVLLDETQLALERDAVNKMPVSVVELSVYSCTVTALPQLPLYEVGEGSKVPDHPFKSIAAVGVETEEVRKPAVSPL